MLIRKPVAEVFEAFVDPEITTDESADYADYTDKKLATKKHKTLKLKIAWLTRTLTQRRRGAK